MDWVLVPNKPKAPRGVPSDAIGRLCIGDYARACADRIIRAGGLLTQTSDGKSVYPNRADLRIPHTQYDPAIERSVATSVRIRVTVEVEYWEPDQRDMIATD